MPPSPSLVDEVCRRLDISTAEDIAWCREALTHALVHFEDARAFIAEETLEIDNHAFKTMAKIVRQFRAGREGLSQMPAVYMEMLDEVDGYSRGEVENFEKQCEAFEGELQKLIDSGKRKAHRPKVSDIYSAVNALADLYGRYTGKLPTLPTEIHGAVSLEDRYKGPFYDLCKIVAQEAGAPILIDKLPEAIRNVRRQRGKAPS